MKPVSGPPPGPEEHADGYETWNQASQYVIELKLVYNLVTHKIRNLLVRLAIIYIFKYPAKTGEVYIPARDDTDYSTAAGFAR